MDSILTSIKKLLGIAEEYTHFDADIIMHINAVFMALYQMGIGPTTCFSITDDSEEWSDFLDDRTDLEAVKPYVYMKVRMAFDPPTSSLVADALKNTIAEHEWRLFTMVENKLFSPDSEE